MEKKTTSVLTPLLIISDETKKAQINILSVSCYMSNHVEKCVFSSNTNDIFDN